MGFADLLANTDRAVRGHLGGVITYVPGVGVSVEVDGIFDASYVLVDSDQTGVSTSGPAVFLTLDDLPSDPVTDLTATVVVNGVTYSIREPKPDGIGGVLLLLHAT